MVVLKNFWNIFKIPELTKKIAITLGIIIIYRLGIFIPTIGINPAVLAEQMSQSSLFKGFLDIFNMFSGGALSQCTIFALGINPYITASIAMQVLTTAIPSLEKLSKEGDYGRKIINQYTRYLSLALSVFYAIGLAATLNTWSLSTPGLLTISGTGFMILCVFSLTAGAMLVMWFSEQITLFGVGNGSSIIIFANIVAQLPALIYQIVTLTPFKAFMLVLLLLTIIALIVYLEKGDRKIPVQYARRVVGQKVYGGQSSYIPFKINPTGVMPIIFASSILSAVIFALTTISSKIAFLSGMPKLLEHGAFLSIVIEFGLIIFFTFFYSQITFNPADLADNLKKSGGFIPGIRPGGQTAKYFDYILTRLGLVGSIYLGLLSIIPTISGNLMHIRIAIGGTSLLIMVGVALELSAQIESYLIEHKYEGFLGSGRARRATR